MGKGRETREHILAVAEASVLAKGFGATSIEEIIAEVGLTKSGFFYHFKDKNELARAMIVRYDGRNREIFDKIFTRAEQLSGGDPLQTLLISLTLFAETMADLPNGHPGCVIASIAYQERLFDREVRRLMAESVTYWVSTFRARISDVAAIYGVVEPKEIERLAQMIYCVIDGSIIVGKVMADPSVLPDQILMVRDYLKMLFQPLQNARRAA